MRAVALICIVLRAVCARVCCVLVYSRVCRVQVCSLTLSVQNYSCDNQQCGSGKGVDVGTSYSCIFCAAGKFSLGDTADCTSCSAGKYSAAVGATADCLSCPPGKFQATVGSSNCVDCHIPIFPAGASCTYTTTGASTSTCDYVFSYEYSFFAYVGVIHILWLASGSICGVVACLALAARCFKPAMVPCSWLVTWVVYSIVAFAVICLWIADDSWDGLLSALVVTACYNSLFHVFVMGVLILRRIQGTNQDEQTRQVPQASLDASAQTVVLSAKLTCFEELFLATIGRIIQLVDLFIWIVSMIGIDLSPFFFPLPFFKFYHARLVTSHYRIRGARIYLNAGFSDAYFLYLQERMLNFLTLTAYTRCKGETYPKWLDSKLQWVGAPPHGYNNHFRIFFNSGTLCERIGYYVQSTILFTFFGWLFLVPANLSLVALRADGAEAGHRRLQSNVK